LKRRGGLRLHGDAGSESNGKLSSDRAALLIGSVLAKTTHIEAAKLTKLAAATELPAQPTATT
jgi:hypothetical protein